MIVVDNSVIVPAFVDGKRSAQARRLHEIDGDWRVPPLWRYEFTNVLVNMLRVGDVELDDAMIYLDEARMSVGSREIAVDQILATRFANRFQLSGYDAQYIVIAEHFGIRCVTDDRRLAKNAPQHAVLLDDFLNEIQ